MRPVLLDKIASVTLNCDLRREVRVGDEYACREGDVVAVRILTRKGTYNSLELATGRMSMLKEGDVIAGALGHRDAVQGYAGILPESLRTGDRLHLLNLGGVLGRCHSYSPLVGPPHECEVIGAVQAFPELHSRRGVPANIASGAPPLDESLGSPIPPVIAVAGSSMNSGKTEACLTLIQQLVRRGWKVAAAKATGVSLRRDILGMQDAGAEETCLFTDFGVVTTRDANAPSLAKTMLNRLSADRPDAIVLELGDGLLGSYGVGAILDDAALAASFSAVVLAAADPVGAWGGVELLRRRHGIEPRLVTGPATDNEAGIRAIERETGIPARNARQSPAEAAEILLRNVEVAHGA